MCGIIALLSKNNCIEYLLDGLKQLQNRGYDSAGICTLDKEFSYQKFASTKKNSAIEMLENDLNEMIDSNLGIAHTRWATHGAKTDENSHPHISCENKVALVHNGIIENYLELKKILLEKGYTFKSQTDTEVISNLIAYEYSLCANFVTA